MSAYSSRVAAVAACAILLGGSVGYYLGHRAATDSARVGITTFKGKSLASNSLGEVEPTSSEGEAQTSSTIPLAGGELERRILAAAHVRDFFRRRHDIYEVGQLLDGNGIRAAMELTQQLSETDRDFTQFPLLSRWLELDSAAAYEWVSALSKPPRRAELIREFFHTMGLMDPATALTFLNRSRAEPGYSEDSTSSLFEAWSSQAPMAAIDAAFQLTDPEMQDSALEAAIGAWAKRDPLGALGRIAQLQDAERRRSHNRTILREWAAEDAEAAASYALGLENQRDRSTALRTVIPVIAARDADTAMRLLEGIPAGSVRTDAVDSVIRALADEDPKTGAEFVLLLPPALQSQNMHPVLRPFARLDPAAALAWADRLSSADARQSGRRSILSTWCEADPKAAAEFCASSPELESSAIYDALGNWAAKDAQEALAWSRTLPVGPLRSSALTGAVRAIARKDPSEAAGLAKTLLNEHYQSETLEMIAGVWAEKDPGGAAAWASQLSDSDTRTTAMISVASTWAREDPAAAAAWAGRIPENGSLNANIAREWALLDPASATNWLNTLPAGGSRDNAVVSFAYAISAVDPATAASWVTTLSQPQQYQNTFTAVYRQWEQVDPARAAGWLRTAPGVSAEQREQLLKSD